MVGGSYFDRWESIWWELMMILSGGPPRVWNREFHEEAYVNSYVNTRRQGNRDWTTLHRELSVESS
jgi:hypothetical protein